MMDKIDGFKTYAACIGLVVFAGLGLVFGYLSGEEAGKILLEAAAIAGLRNAL